MKSDALTADALSRTASVGAVAGTLVRFSLAFHEYLVELYSF